VNQRKKKEKFQTSPTTREQTYCVIKAKSQLTVGEKATAKCEPSCRQQI